MAIIASCTCLINGPGLDDAALGVLGGRDIADMPTDRADLGLRAVLMTAVVGCG